MPANRVLEGALSWVTFFGQAKKVTRPPGMAGETTHGREAVFAPTPKDKNKMDSGFRRNDDREAFVGMTIGEAVGGMTK